MIKQWLFVMLASASLAQSALAAPPDSHDRKDDKEGSKKDTPKAVPFNRLQRQIDKLRARVHALEVAQPAGQSCPQGEFVTGFSSAGAILCAAPGVTPPPPPPPPPPAPIPDSFKAALQQGVDSLAAQARPLALPAQTLLDDPAFGTMVCVPLTYDLAVGAIQVSQPTATTVSIQIPVASAAARIRCTLNSVIGNQTEVLTLRTSGLASAQATIVTTASGTRRLGSVTFVDLDPTSVSVIGGGIFGVVLDLVATLLGDTAIGVLENEMAAALNQMLPSLPDF